MKRKNLTRNALFTSIISLLLCVSMLVGTTFAWFTDSVASGVNNIIAGNLDIELEYSKNGSSWESVSAATDLFSGDLWEPGHTEVVYLRLKNKGTLALNYQLGINIRGENEATNVAGETFKLSDYIQFGVAEGETVYASREAAVAAVSASSKKLNEGFTKATSMLPGAETEMALVVYMPTTVGNEANYRGTAPEIHLGINVVATQKTHENDSFDNQYDADVEDMPADMPIATVTRATQYENTELQWGSYGSWSPTAGLESNLEAAYTFECQETPEEAANNKYADWYCDFYVKLNKDLGENELFMGGNYGIFGWVGFHNGTVTPKANEEIALLGSVTTNPWTYADVAANVGTFVCGVGDVNDALAGATFTVMLRLTNPDDENEFYNLAKINYTFPAAEVSTMAELDAALKAGSKLIDAKGANLGDFDYSAKFTDGAVIKNAKFTYFYGGNVEGTVTFENCEFVSDHSYSANFDSGNGKLVFNKCLFDGWSSFGTAITGVEMNNCSFQKSYNHGILRFYQNAVLNNCTFADSFEGVDTNQDGTIVKINNCTGVAGKIFNNGAKVGTWIVDGQDISATITSW